MVTSGIFQFAISGIGNSISHTRQTDTIPPTHYNLPTPLYFSSLTARLLTIAEIHTCVFPYFFANICCVGTFMLPSAICCLYSFRMAAYMSIRFCLDSVISFILIDL